MHGTETHHGQSQYRTPANEMRDQTKKQNATTERRVYDAVGLPAGNEELDRKSMTWVGSLH